jgi:hypothetical protein
MHRIKIPVVGHPGIVRTGDLTGDASQFPLGKVAILRQTEILAIGNIKPCWKSFLIGISLAEK